MAQQPCLPVPRRRKREDDSPVAFDNIDSMDAMEYMSAVVQQAGALPDVFVADKDALNRLHRGRQDYVPIDGSAASLSYLLSKHAAVLPPPTTLHGPPSRTWVHQTLANFSQLRSYLDQCQNQGVGGKETDRLALPPLRDRPSWHVFCVGLDEATGNAGSYFEDSDDTDDSSPTCRQTVPPTGHEPSARLLLQMDQVMVRRVLSHLSHYVQQGWSASSEPRAAWLYALLARLERPLHREDVAILYALLKDCTNARANVNLESDAGRKDLARLNTLIAILGLSFEQGGGYSAVMEALEYDS